MPDVELWQALIGLLVAALGGGGVAKILTVRSLNRRTDAKTMAEAYGHIIDRVEGEVARQGKELIGLREHITELLGLIRLRDHEIVDLRAELAHERAESSRLRERVSDLEAHAANRRSTDTT